MNRLDAMPRSELRRLASALVELVGPDAVARLTPDTPFEPPTDAPQLALMAVDPATTERRAHDWLFAVVGVVRGAATITGLPEAFDTERASAALRARLRELAEEVVASLHYDPTAGLRLASILVRLVDRAAHACASYPDAPPLWTADDAGEALTVLLSALDEAVPRLPCDEDRVRTLATTGATLRRLGFEERPFARIGALVDADRELRLPTLRRYCEREATGSQILPMLELLSERTTAATADTFVQCAELHLQREPRAADVLVATLRRLGLEDQAHYWDGERYGRSHA